MPDYLCQREGIARGVTPCQRIPGRDLDAAVGAMLLEVMTSEAIATILAVQDELLARAADAEPLRQRQVERAQYEADLAQRRYLHVDPENRLVADVLEAEWNDKLRALTTAREAAEQQRQSDEKRLSPSERAAMLGLPRDFAQIWRDPRTPDRERKRIVRLLIEDVTLEKGAQIVARIRFKGGAARTLTVPLPPPFAQSRLTPAATLAEIDRLLDHFTDAEVAAELHAHGHRPFAGLPFRATHVSERRRAHHLKDRYPRLRDAGMLTAEELAARLGVTPQTIWRRYHQQDIDGARFNDRGTRLFRPPAAGASSQLAQHGRARR